MTPSNGGFKTAEYKPVFDKDVPPVLRYNAPVETVHELYYLPASPEPIGRVAAASGEYVFDGDPGDLAGGEWVVADDGKELHALRIRQVTKGDGEFSVSFQGGGSLDKPIASKDVDWIDGVDVVFRGELESLKVSNIGELADLDVPAKSAALAPGSALRGALLWEFHAKARMLMDFEPDAAALSRFGGATLAAILIALQDEPDAVRDQFEPLRVALDDIHLGKLTLLDFVSRVAGSEQRLVRLIGPFAETIRPAGYDRDTTPFTGLRLLLDTTATGGLSDLLTVGKTILLEKENDARDGFEDPLLTTIKAIDADAGAIEIDVELSAEHGFTVGNLVVRGNVVSAGHGETRPVKVLGSGQASQPGQSFVLEVDDVAFVADAAYAAGVRAAIDLIIDGQTWQPVDTLNDSAPADAHYTVRPTEDGFLLLQTGDGTRGRRLPTGSSNVTVRYRVGTGLAGNIAAGGLKLAKPHYLVAGVRQLFDATGGGDAEGVESLRTNAAASVLTLERAVSLSDFAALAAAQASVWQAAARELRGTQRGLRRVEVIVVPAGGGELGNLETALVETLNAHTLPDVDVLITRFTSVAFRLDVTVRVRSEAFDPAVVAADVRTVLLAALSLEHRKLGQDIYLSEIIEIVESTAGVENSTCVLNAEPALRRSAVDQGSVAHLDAEGSILAVRTEEFAL